MIRWMRLKKIVGGQHRHGDFPELLHLGSTIQRSRFIQGIRNLLQPGEEHQHTGTELPHTHQDDDEQSSFGVAQQGEFLFDANGRQQAHKNTLVAENLLPDHGNSDRAADDGRDVIQNTIKRHAHVLFVQQRCHEQRKGQTERHHDKDIAERNDQRLAKGLIGCKNSDIVFQSDPVGGGQQVIIRKGIVDGHRSRDHIHEDESKQPRSQQQIADFGIIAKIVLFQRNSFCV